VHVESLLLVYYQLMNLFSLLMEVILDELLEQMERFVLKFPKILVVVVIVRMMHDHQQ
jgi:hypothetical protein